MRQDLKMRQIIPGIAAWCSTQPFNRDMNLFTPPVKSDNTNFLFEHFISNTEGMVHRGRELPVFDFVQQYHRFKRKSKRKKDWCETRHVAYE